MQDAIPFSALEGIKKISSDFTRFGNDYMFARIDSSSYRLPAFSEPVRVSGIAICLLLRGNLTLEINTQLIELSPISIFAFSESSMIRVRDVDRSDIDAYLLLLSAEFVRDLHIEHQSIRLDIPPDGQMKPVIDNLTENEITMLSELMDLLYRNAVVNPESPFTHNVSKSIIQALVYQLFQIKHDHMKTVINTSDKPINRRIGYVNDFMHLVKTHYSKERSLQFYADHLFISPKYLSRIIKEITGRSAADWIDTLVLQEAKNMLRFSGKSIQQVAYALNFPTQSSFGKFFKHLTGMSPSEYQQS